MHRLSQIPPATGITAGTPSTDVDIDNEVAIRSVLSDHELIKAMLVNNGENDDYESNVSEVPLRLTVAEALAVPPILEDFCESTISIDTFHSIKAKKIGIVLL